MKKLYKVTMGDKDTKRSCSASSGYWHVIARSIADAVKKAEHGDVNKAIAVELIAIESIGLKP